MKIKIISLLTILLFSLNACFADDITKPEKPRETRISAGIFGVNLAGAEFGEAMPGVFNQDYTYPTVAELDYFKSKGLKLIRLPFRWERLQPVLGAELDKSELKRLKDFVEEAAKRDIFILLDLHNSARYALNGKEIRIGSSLVTTSHIRDLWTKLAAEFKNHKNIWGYGIMNEPADMANKTHWFGIAQEIITGIRTKDTATAIVVGGDSWSSAERWPEESDNLKNLKDPSNNLIFEAHVYFDKDASGQYLGSYDDEEANPMTGVKRVQPFIDWLKSNNLRGFIGEYGVPNDDDRWKVTLDNFLNHLAKNCLNGTYWAAGPWWGEYPLSLEIKDDGADQNQMAVVKNYSQVVKSCSY